MPIYGYVCKSCEHTFDALQKMSDDPLVDCPECGAPELRKQLSAPKFRLKGGGWYSDLYASSKKDGGDKGDKGGAGESSGAEKGGSSEKKDKGAGGKAGSKKSGSKKGSGGKAAA